jgi:hypothetical protein
MKGFASLGAVAAATAGTAVAIAGGLGLAASSAQTTTSLPTVTITMTKTAITVGGALQSGAVDIASTTTNEASGSPTIVRLNPGATPAQLDALVASRAGQDLNNAGRVGQIVFSADAPRGTSHAQTTLTPGEYVALDTAGNNPRTFPRTTFVVTAAAQPATLPAAGATLQSREFGFTGPTTLRNGEVVRLHNGGFLAHMIVAIRARNTASLGRLRSALESGNDRRAQALATGFVGLQEPVSPGATQQVTVRARPGTYLLACFLDTQDGREHTQLHMVRRIRIR